MGVEMKEVRQVCVFEDDPGGHRLAHARILLGHAHKATGIKPLFATTREVLNSTQYKVNLKKIESRFETFLFSDEVPAKRFARWSAFSRVVRTAEARGCGRVLFPTADKVVDLIGAGRLLGFQKFKIEVRCGVLRLDAPYTGFHLWRRIKNWVSFFLQQKAGVQILYYDNYAVDRMRGEYGAKLTGVSDPPLLMGHDPVKSRDKKSIKKTGLCFGTIGCLDYRKGTDLLLEAFQRARLPKDASLLIAGELRTTHLRENILSAQSRMGDRRVRFCDEFLGDRAYWRFLNQMDVVCLPYRKHIGASGVFAQAAILGKIILTCDYGWLGWEGEKYNKGLVFKNNSMDSMVAAMEGAWKNRERLLKLKSNYKPVDKLKYLRAFCGF
jgi:glycosyltransferase involved in cell wall biosynthesis